jgi:exosome complex RNA-binding protein Csl4
MKLSSVLHLSALSFSSRTVLSLAICAGLLCCPPLFAAEGEGLQLTQSTPQPHPSSKTRTIVADLLMIDGSFYVVRGERGEIRIEVTPDTELSETFQFGDRIKAVVLPNDRALSIIKAQPGESIGTTREESGSIPSQPSASPDPSAPSDKSQSPQQAPSSPKEPAVRIIIADLLMVEGNFYIVRDANYGEIQIEITPETDLSESFNFGDRIKARVTPQDKALSIVRAAPGESPGISLEEGSMASPSTTPPVQMSPGSESALPEKEEFDVPPSGKTPKTRTVVAEILMVDGDFYVVRGERGEIRIEVTPDTNVTETFKFGDKIKARILPDDTALSIKRAQPGEPSGEVSP